MPLYAWDNLSNVDPETGRNALQASPLTFKADFCETPRTDAQRAWDQVNPLEFNAVINGAATQEKLADAFRIAAQNSKGVSLHGGSYILDGSISAHLPVAIQGDGMAATRFYATDLNAPFLVIAEKNETVTEDTTYGFYQLSDLSFVAEPSTTGLWQGEPAPNSAGIKITGDNAHKFLAYSRMENISAAGLRTFLYVDKAVDLNGESTVAWMDFSKITIVAKSSSPLYGFHWTKGSGTGTTYSGIKGNLQAANSSYILYEGADCYVGDVVVSGSHFGGIGAGVSVIEVGPNTLYRSRLAIVASQVDAGVSHPFKLSTVGSVEYSGLIFMANNVGGNVDVWTGLGQPVRNSIIHEQDVDDRRAGARKTSDAIGAQSIPVFKVGQGEWNFSLVEITVGGVLWGLDVCGGTYRYHLRSSTTDAFLDEIQRDLTPTALPGQLQIVPSWTAGSKEVTFSVVFTSIQANNRFEVQIVVRGGSTRLQRL
jgi:hypothetical protein